MLESIKKTAGPLARCALVRIFECYCLPAGALSAGGVVALFMSVLAGGVVAGRLVAAPVVVPGWLLLRGVTSRMPGGAAGLAGVVCAVWLGGVVPAWFTVVLFKP